MKNTLLASASCRLGRLIAKQALATLWLVVLLCGSARASAAGLQDALTPEGELRRGVVGSFEATNYALFTAPDGHPVFRPLAPQRVAGVLGAGDANWSNAFQASGPNDIVRAVAVDGSGNVYVGGRFTSIGGVAANYIAKWNGSNWSALGTGTNHYVSALVFDGSGNLYVGGRFLEAGGIQTPGVAKWDGTNWSAMNSGTNGWVLCLALDNSGNLYAGGNFSSFDGRTANGVAKWNGSSWSALGTGLEGATLFTTVFALALDQTGSLYAGGLFDTAGGAPASNIAKWNGSSWSALGSGIEGQTNGINALVVDGAGTLYAGGYFTVAGGVRTPNLAKWNGSSWAAVGGGIGGTNSQSTVYALSLNAAGDLFVGGDFATAGAQPMRNIVKWNGTAWSSLGTGLNGAVYALRPTATGLYAGGNFTAVGDGSKTTTRIGFYASTPLATAATRPTVDLALYPNPARGAVTVRLPPVPGATAATFTLLDALGREVRTQQAPLSPTGTTALFSLAKVPAGVYQLRVAVGGLQATRALVVE